MMNLPLPTASACWRLAPGLLLLTAVLLLFRDTAAAMVSIWTRSETFAHAFLVPPIVLWMVWRRRALLATLQPQPAPWVLLPMAAICLLWLLAELASVNAATQFALVTLLVLSVPAVFGLQVAHALLFPLLFLYFAVPVGEFMVPHMMEWTADFTVAAVQLSGVPVFREGLQFVIPTGSWSVVEACSGVRYLIASFMVGTLFAYLNFTSTRRRVIFMLVSLAVPVVANWFRAYLIVMLGHVSGNKLAAGVDHIIYGWVFFGVVIGVMFMVGSRWAEPDAPLPVPGPASAAKPLPAQGGGWLVGGGALLLLLTVQGLLWQLNRAPERGAPQLVLAQASAQQWASAAAPLSEWRPNFADAVLDVSRSYTEPASAAAPRQVAVWVAYYRDQKAGRKLVTSTNTLVDAEMGSGWGVVSEGGSASVSTAGGAVVLRTATLRGSVDVGDLRAQRLRVWQVYWVGGHLTTSGARARVHLALQRLRGDGDDGAALFFYTPLDSATDALAVADRTLGSFVAAELPVLVQALESAKTSTGRQP